MAASGRVRPTLVLIAALGIIVAILLGILWTRNTSRAWGIGPEETQKKAVALCTRLGITPSGTAKQRVVTTDQGSFWLTEWMWADTAVAVIQKPSGEVVRLTAVPSSDMIARIERDARSWAEMAHVALDSLFGDVSLVGMEEDGQLITFRFTSESGDALILSVPRGPWLKHLELARENPPSLSAERSPYPAYLLTIVLAVLLVAIALPSLWQPVAEARANPEGVAVWAGIAGSAALLFSLWDLLPQGSIISASIAFSVAFSAGAAALALAGTYITNSQPPEHRARSADDSLLSGLLLGFLGVGLASAAYVLPAAAQGTVNRFISSPLISLQAFLVAAAAAIALEFGVRPIVTAILSKNRGLIQDVAIALVGSFWVPFSASTPWLWSKLVIFLAVLFAGHVNRRYGSWAGCLTAATFFLTWSFIPGLALPGSRCVLAVVVGVTGLLAGPAALRQRLRSRQPREQSWPPEYVKRICEQASLDHVDTLAASLQPATLQGFESESNELDEAALCKRATPPAADICRVTRHGKSRLGILFTEVPGRGIQGAFQAGIISTATDALAKDPKRPSDLLLKLHSIVCSAWVGEGGPTSIVYGVLDRRSNSFTFAGLGNHHVLLRRALVGRFEHLTPASGPFDPLTPVEVDAMLDAQTVQLISRDLLVLFTDGLVHATSPQGEKFGTERLENLIRERKDATCGEIAAALESELDSFLGGNAPADDIIVLFFRGSH